MDGVERMYGFGGTTVLVRLKILSSSSNSSWSSFEKVLRLSDRVVGTSGGSRPDMVMGRGRGYRVLGAQSKSFVVDVQYS